MKLTSFTPEFLAENIKPVVQASNLWQGKKLILAIIANPAAGGFTRPKVAAMNQAILSDYRKKAGKMPVCSAVTECCVFKTEYAGHGSKYAEEILNRIKTDPEKNYLLITAGGDGTHLEVQTALAKAAFASDKDAELIRNNMTLLRLPFGTGNDGSDDRTLDKTLERFIRPSHVSLQRAVKVYYEGRISHDKKNQRRIDKYDSLDATPPWYSFNIASIGIDAFVTYMTNKTKRIMPGDSYQLWVDLACVFYGFSFPAKTVKIRTFDKDGNQLAEISSPVEFALLGVSGHRTYGSDHRILPREDCFCTVKKMSLIRKLLRKSEFNDGSHVDDTKYCTMGQASKIIIDYDQDILVQMDGEVHLLRPGCYPLVMEHTEPVIPIIELDSSTIYKGAEPYKR
ncbi:MAG: hypothetical protein MJ183_02970 [Treponemataceae bacterium]|nr:hypothetical protein [Treponemataceae bacterium]